MARTSNPTETTPVVTFRVMGALIGAGASLLFGLVALRATSLTFSIAAVNLGFAIVLAAGAAATWRGNWWGAALIAAALGVFSLSLGAGGGIVLFAMAAVVEAGVAANLFLSGRKGVGSAT
jgi:hypothetical protein